MSYDHDVNEEEFPRGAAESEQLRFLVHYAVLAPSGHNTQPWLFKIENGHLDLIADRTRALAVVDPEDRALTISCGAALEHLAIASRYFGRELTLEFPKSDPDLLARVRLGREIGPGPSDTAMFLAIPKRRTTRAKYEKRALPYALRNTCRDLAQDAGVELTIISDEQQREAISELVAEGDRIQFADPRFRRELAAWIHSRRAASRDGMSGAGFGMPDLLSRAGALVIRTFDMGDGVAAADRDKIVEGSPLLAVFGTQQDQLANWIATGRALTRVLLTLTASGATAAFLNQPVEVEQLRPRLREVVGTSCIPQLLMRFGYGPEVRHSVRRPTESVLI
jgi:nitroreductase